MALRVSKSFGKIVEIGMKSSNFLRGAPPRTPLGLCPRPRLHNCLTPCPWTEPLMEEALLWDHSPHRPSHQIHHCSHRARLLMVRQLLLLEVQQSPLPRHSHPHPCLAHSTPARSGQEAAHVPTGDKALVAARPRVPTVGRACWVRHSATHDRTGHGASAQVA